MNFVEKHNFRIVSGESHETVRKLFLSTKFPYQKIRWNYGIFRSGKISLQITEIWWFFFGSHESCFIIRSSIFFSFYVSCQEQSVSMLIYFIYTKNRSETWDLVIVLVIFFHFFQEWLCPLSTINYIFLPSIISTLLGKSTNKLRFDSPYQKCVNNVMKQIMKQCFIN